MKFYLLSLLIVLAANCSVAQTSAYRESPAKVNDLVHTRLDVRFDYQKCYLYGKEWVTVQPHFYPTDSLRLDAKGMDIQSVGLVENGAVRLLKFVYDSLSVNIRLNRLYRKGEKYVVYIAYTAKPNERKGIQKNEKGLYFINPDGKEKDKPTQIWTEGEPESSSVWFPTIDKPNQKTTSDLSMTVPAKYVTLSNGRLASQKSNGDGTRTDTWKMELPHAPYLFMMAAGDFKIYKDSWHGKEVSYYLEPRYAPYAKDMFGDVPEAIEFFSKITGVDYPWNKYSSIVVRDYVSGAMENTTANVFGEQHTRRELMDIYYNPGVEHELFHQWFGDYVTCESWSNLTLNESFADFGELIWLEHKYGKDAADERQQNGLQGYLGNKDNFKIPLVNYNYKKVSDVFNGITYQKGGRILIMLRNYLGDAAFYKGLNLYLTKNAFKNAEAHQLRLAMEEASGLDLNWFFNQWYFGAGHPVLDISYKWDEIARRESVYLSQNQEGQVFRLPLAIDIYVAGKTYRHNIVMNRKQDTVSFILANKPDLVNIDADKVLVAQKDDHKTASEFAFQYSYAPLYADRLEALEFASKNQADGTCQKIIVAALHDRFSGLRNKAIEILNMTDENVPTMNASLRQAAIPELLQLAESDENTMVRTMALVSLAPLKNPQYMKIFREGLTSESYEVEAAGLHGIKQLDIAEAIKAAAAFEKDNEGDLTKQIFNLYAANGGDAKWDYIFGRYANGTLQEKIHLMEKFSEMIGRLKAPVYIKQGIGELTKIGTKYKPVGAGPYVIGYLNIIKEARSKQNDNAGAALAAKAIEEINSSK